MSSSSGSLRALKNNYSVSRRIESFYTGGPIQITQAGDYMFCPCENKINIVDIATGDIIHSIEQDDESDITVFALSNDDEILVTASEALLLKQWDWLGNKCTRTWKAGHTAPVASMTFDPSSTLLATGGCDSTIKVWDIPRQYCTNNLKGSSGVVHLVKFHPDISQPQLFSSSMDNSIRLWDLKSSQCVSQLDNHYSLVTSLSFCPDNETLISSGRDKICTVWDLKKRAVKSTIPVHETIESVVILPQELDLSNLGVTKSTPHFLTAGSKGILRVWDSSTATCVHSQSLPCPPAVSKAEVIGQHSLMHCSLVPTKSEVIAVNVDRNICLYDAQTLDLKKQFSGYNGEVLDVRFLGPKDSHIVVATNSPQLKVFDLSSSNCQILEGHTDTVLALDVFRKGRLFASCGKDKTVRVWRMADNGEVFCVAQGQGHANQVGALGCSKTKENFLVTGSQDRTIKVWLLPKRPICKEAKEEGNKANEEGSKAKEDGIKANEEGNKDEKKAKEEGKKCLILEPQKTQVAHDKDINSVAVSPNDKLIATGSQDKTAKLWSSDDCSPVGVCSGHKRGVWCVEFSPTDQVLATSSADGTVKLWNLQDCSCLKTLEGHDSSVLKVIFVSSGGQMLTSDADGLLKLWTIQNNECVKTLDAHDNKVWGMHANRRDDTLVTGAADSRVLVWKDVTQAELEEEHAKKEEQILKEQELSNLLHMKQYLKALGFAISLDRPYTVLTVVRAILKEPSGKEDLTKNMMKLRKDQKEALLKYSVTWNTNSRNCYEAQAVIEIFLRHESPGDLLKYDGIKTAVESLLPYTERHYHRLGRLLQASMFLDFMWQNMRLAEAPRWDDEMDT